MTHPSRRLWQTVETLHAVTYFAPQCRDAASAAGLRGFWMGYFACRAAPLGPIGPAPVAAAFAGFRPSMVARALPDAWGFLEPARCVAVRLEAATGALVAAGVDEVACGEAADRLEPVVDALDPTGRPLAAANASLPLADDPVARCWQAATTLREHRGDGHVAAVVAAGLSGLEAHVLQAARSGIEPEDLRSARGWTAEEWTAAEGALARRGLDGAAGAALLEEVEARTDELAWSAGLAVLGEAGIDAVRDALAPSVAAVVGTEWIRFPNPMGLPRPEGP
jgi:hypothetical protein